MQKVNIPISDTCKCCSLEPSKKIWSKICCSLEQYDNLFSNHVTWHEYEMLIRNDCKLNATNPPDFHKRAVARLAHSKPSWSKAWPQASSVKDMHNIGAFKLKNWPKEVILGDCDAQHRECSGLPHFLAPYIQSALRLPFTGHQLGVLVLYEHCQLCPRQHALP